VTGDAGAGDPFRPMRDAYGKALESWAKAMEDAVSSEEFAQASGRILSRYAELQESLRAASASATEQLHLPTVDDLARIATLVANVERKVDEVSNELHTMNTRLARIEAAMASRRDDPAPGD